MTDADNCSLTPGERLSNPAWWSRCICARALPLSDAMSTSRCSTAEYLKTRNLLLVG